MGITIGPADWWVASPEAIDSLAISCPEATTLPDGSRIICKAGGKVWIVAPETTQVSEFWGNYTACGAIDNSPVGESVHSDITNQNFPILYNCLISCGFNPSDWFVPSFAQLQNPGYCCRTKWDSYSTFPGNYWSSTEIDSANACGLNFDNGSPSNDNKTFSRYVRAFRCVTY